MVVVVGVEVFRLSFRDKKELRHVMSLVDDDLAGCELFLFHAQAHCGDEFLAECRSEYACLLENASEVIFEELVFDVWRAALEDLRAFFEVRVREVLHEFQIFQDTHLRRFFDLLLVHVGPHYELFLSEFLRSLLHFCDDLSDQVHGKSEEDTADERHSYHEEFLVDIHRMDVAVADGYHRYDCKVDRVHVFLLETCVGKTSVLNPIIHLTSVVYRLRTSN